jgi:ferredoxin
VPGRNDRRSDRGHDHARENGPLPERIQLDECGFPILDPEPVTGEAARHAARAVEACPTLALLLENAQAAARDPQERRSRNP